MDVSVRSEPSADTRVVRVFEGEQLDAPLQALVDSGEAKAELKRTAVFHDDGRRVILAGAGKRSEADAERLRVAAAAAATRAKELSSQSLAWLVPETPGATTGIVQGTLLALYRFDRFKSNADDGTNVEALELIGGSDADADPARIEAEAQNAARDLQNLPANVATPEFLSARARELEGVEVDVLGRDEIEARGMGALAAVSQGTYVEPQLIVLRYDGGGSGPPLGYVGKAMTFSCGST